MSRFYDDGDYADYNNAYELWEWNLTQALGSARGQQALRELREALLALPEHRLIARALCTVGGDRRPSERIGHGFVAMEFDELLAEQGAGVCTVGAFAWYRKVKSGLHPAEAFTALPTLGDYNHESWETAVVGKQAGLAKTLAEYLAYQNDETWGDCTPEERWQKCIYWVDAQLSVSGGVR